MNCLNMLIANALIDLAKLVAKPYKSELVYDSSTIEIQKFAANVTDTQLENAKVLRKSQAALRNLQQGIQIPLFLYYLLTKFQTIADRNQQAHESSKDFAQLISQQYFKETHVFEQWKEIFPLLYGESVEMLAAQKEESNSMLLGPFQIENAWCPEKPSSAH